MTATTNAYHRGVGHTVPWGGSGARSGLRAVAGGAPLLVVAMLLLKLAISEGGRHLGTLTLAQTILFAITALLVGSGSVRDVPILRPLLGMTAVIAFTAIVSVRPDSSLRELLLWLMYASVFITVSSSLRTLHGARRLLDAVLVVGGWLSLIGLYLFWGAETPQLRWYSTFYTPNPFAAFLLLMLPLAAARCALARTSREAAGFGALAVLLAVAFTLTYSRGAYVALALTGLLGGVVVRPPSWKVVLRRLTVVAIATALAVTILTQGSSGVGARINELEADSGSVLDRLSFWRAGAAIFLDHPATGTGPGTFAFAHAKYQGRYYARDAHNIYVQMAAEMGIPGLVAVIVLLVALASVWVRTLRKARGTEAYPLAAGIGLSLGAYLVHSGMEMNWQFPANPAVAFTLAAILAWYDRWTGSWEGARRRRLLGHPAWRVAAVCLLLAGVAGVQLLRAAEVEFQRGRELVSAGQWPEASAAFRRAMTLNPLDPRLPSALAVTAQRHGSRTEDAQVLIRQAMTLDRMNAYYPLQLAEILFPQAGQPEVGREVERLLLAALDLDPLHYPEAYGRLAQFYAGRGEPDRAEAVYARAAQFYSARPVDTDLVLRIRLWPRVAALYSEWAAFRASQGTP